MSAVAMGSEVTTEEVEAIRKDIREDGYRRAARLQGGFVYFIRAVGTPFVKIGWAQDVERRRRENSTGSAAPLVTLAYARGGMAIERGLHKVLAKRRSRGEWFEMTDAEAHAVASKVHWMRGGTSVSAADADTMLFYDTDVPDESLQKKRQYWLFSLPEEHIAAALPVPAASEPVTTADERQPLTEGESAFARYLVRFVLEKRGKSAAKKLTPLSVAIESSRGAP